MDEPDGEGWTRGLVVLGISALVSLALFAQVDATGSMSLHFAAEWLFRIFLALLLLRLPAPRRWILHLPARARGASLVGAVLAVALLLALVARMAPLLDPTTAFVLILLVAAGSFTANTLDSVARAIVPSERALARPALALLLAVPVAAAFGALALRLRPPAAAPESALFWIVPPLHYALLAAAAFGAGCAVAAFRGRDRARLARRALVVAAFLAAFSIYLGIALSAVEAGRVAPERLTALAILTLVLKLLEPTFAVAEKTVVGATLLKPSESAVFMLTAAFALLQLYLAYLPAAGAEVTPGRVLTILEAMAALGLLLGALTLPWRRWRAARRAATAPPLPSGGGFSLAPLLGIFLLVATAVRTQVDHRAGGLLLGLGLAACLGLALAHAHALADLRRKAPRGRFALLAAGVFAAVALVLALLVYVGGEDALDAPAWLAVGLLGGALVGEYLSWSAGSFADASAADSGSRSRAGALMPLALLLVLLLQGAAWLARGELVPTAALLVGVLAMLVAIVAIIVRPTGQGAPRVAYWLTFAALLAASAWHFVGHRSLPLPILLGMAVAFLQMTTGDPAQVAAREVLDRTGVRAWQVALTFAVVLTLTGGMRLGAAVSAPVALTMLGVAAGLVVLPLARWLTRARLLARGATAPAGPR